MSTNGRVLAAIYDCEGWINIHPSGSVRLGLEMCEPHYVASLNSAFYGGKVRVREPRTAHARPLLDLIARYALIKQRQAEIALEAIDTKPGEKKDGLIRYMKVLNRKGRVLAPEAVAA